MKRLFSRHVRLFSSIVATILFALVPLFVKSPYYLDLLIVTIINAVLAMTFIMMLRTGLISLAIAAFWGIGSYASAVLVMHAHISFWLSLPLSTLITAIFAFVLGYALIRNAGFTFVILTTVIGMLFVVAVGNIPALNGYNGIPNIPPPDTINIPFLPPLVFNSKVAFFYLALFLFAIIILVINAFYSAWTGRAWNAIGLNPRLAQSMGINVFRYRLLSFIVASAIAGAIGSFYAHYQAFIIPTTYSLFPKAIYVIMYAILGGVEYAILGPLVGAALMTFFPELVRMTQEISIIFNGALVVLLIIFLPKGLLSLLRYRSNIAGWVKAILPSRPANDGAAK
jgi:branched-chain amino acid transport system permease protein